MSKRKPKFLFVMETKVRRVHAERIICKLGFDGLFYVEDVGTAGGIALI